MAQVRFIDPANTMYAAMLCQNLTAVESVFRLIIRTTTASESSNVFSSRSSFYSNVRFLEYRSRIITPNYCQLIRAYTLMCMVHEVSDVITLLTLSDDRNIHTIQLCTRAMNVIRKIIAIRRL